MPAVRKIKDSADIPESVGAQLARKRKRVTKICQNPECGIEFQGLAVSNYCSDECRFRAAYLRRKEEQPQ